MDFILSPDDLTIMFSKIVRSNLILYVLCYFSVFRFIADRSPHWLKTLRKLFETTPTAAVGEVSLFIS